MTYGYLMILNILIVDDEPNILEQAKVFLEKEDEKLRIHISPSAREALDKMKNTGYDCIVSDYKMPEMNGLEFLEILRREMNSKIPFIIFTGKGREEVAIRALNLGADRYIQKGGDIKTQYGILANAICQEVESARAEKELIENKRKFEQLFEINPAPTHLFDKNGILIEVNQAVSKSLGYTKRELIGKHILELPFLTGKARKTIAGFLQDYTDEDKNEKIRQLKPQKAIIEVTGKNGKSHVGEVSANLIKDDTGIKGIIGIVRDITEQEKLKEKHQIAMEGSVNGIYLFQDGEFKFINDGLVNMSGYSREELKDINFLELVHPDYRGKIEKWTGQALTGDTSGLPEKVEFKALRKDGGHIWVQLTPSLREYEGKPAVIGNVTDVTDLKNYEKKTEELKIAVDATRDSIYIIDRNLNYIFANHEHVSRLFKEGKISGDSKDIVIGHNYREIHTERELENIKEKIEKILVSGKSISEEYNFITEDRWSSRTYSPVKNPETGETYGFVIVSKDITDLKEYEEELKRKERYLDHIPEFIQVIDEKGDIKYRSQDLLSENILDADEIRDSNILEFVHPEDLKKTQETFFKVLENPGKEYRVESRGKTKDGWVWFEGRMINYLDKPEIDGIIVTGRDISKSKEAEKREKFLHSLLRHDIQNKAQIIQGYHELLKDHELSVEAEEYLEKASKAVTDNIDLIEKVSTLREIDKKEEVTEFSINSIIKNVIRESKPQASEKGIEINFKDLNCRVLGGTLLKELFSNLIENAIIHSNCSQIQITTREEDGECVVTIEDDGIGIPDKHKEKLFERGYKAGRHSGSGLGTHIAQKIAESYGGSIEVKGSELGGARFDVRLERLK